MKKKTFNYWSASPYGMPGNTRHDNETYKMQLETHANRVAEFRALEKTLFFQLLKQQEARCQNKANCWPVDIEILWAMHEVANEYGREKLAELRAKGVLK